MYINCLSTATKTNEVETGQATLVEASTEGNDEEFSITLDNVKKSERKADILTVASEIEIDGERGFRCTNCTYALINHFYYDTTHQLMIANCIVVILRRNA